MVLDNGSEGEDFVSDFEDVEVEDSNVEAAEDAVEDAPED